MRHCFVPKNFFLRLRSDRTAAYRGVFDFLIGEVSKGTLDHVYVSYVHPGHTSCDVDRVFSSTNVDAATGGDDAAVDERVFDAGEEAYPEIVDLRYSSVVATGQQATPWAARLGSLAAHDRDIRLDRQRVLAVVEEGPPAFVDLPTVCDTDTDSCPPLKRRRSERLSARS